MSTILVVAGDEDLLQMLREVLVGCGHEVETTAEVPAALAAVAARRFDLAVIDVAKDSSGNALARHVRSLPGADRPAVLTLSALHDGAGDEDLAGQLDATALLDAVARLLAARLAPGS